MSHKEDLKGMYEWRNLRPDGTPYPNGGGQHSMSISTIPRKPVKSSQLAEVGHDPVTNTLACKMPTGAIYHYANVPAHIHKALVTAKSVGSYFINTIKKNPGQYPFTKVKGPDSKTEAK